MSKNQKGNGLRNAFDLQPGEVISLVGGGGKTTLMFALAQELFSQKGLVVTTTTTKIFPPSSNDTPFVFVSSEWKKTKDFILDKAQAYGHVTLVSEALVESGKLNGIDPEWILELSRLNVVTYTIVEADGAARRPLKAPNIDHEPVIPRNSSLIIPVVGMDALGCELREEHVFRAEIAARLTGLEMGEIVSTETIATLITHSHGMTYGSPDHARIVPFINKTDLKDSRVEAKQLAATILKKGHPRISRVVLGQANCQPPEIGVVLKG